MEWNDKHETEFTAIKNLIASAPVLKYFDSDQPIVIQTDSSKAGIGCCLLQNSQPVAFASQALTKTEQRYSQIEKELLAIVFAAEKFHYYIYGQSVTVQSDHKPLQTILRKPFEKISGRLQRLCLRLLKYNLSVVYTPGPQMYIADALSRAFTGKIPDEDIVQTFQVHTHTRVVTTTAKKRQSVKETVEDPVLSIILKYVTEGWSDSRAKLHPSLARYWGLQCAISETEQLLFFENRLMVPAKLKPEILQLLHEGHLNEQKMKRLAEEICCRLGI